MTDSKHVLGTIFSSHSKDHCFHSTTKREANLTFNVLTPDSKKNDNSDKQLIFLLRQTLYLLLEISSVLSVSWEKSSLTNMLVPFSFLANIRLDEDVFRKRLRDVLVKTNIFVLVICLQDVFKTSC